MAEQSPVIQKLDRHLQLWIYFLPVVGIIPSMWTLYNKRSDQEKQKASRLSITLAASWLALYILLFISAGQTSEIWAFRLLYANALITTGYFLTCLTLLLRLKSTTFLEIPMISKGANQISRKS